MCTVHFVTRCFVKTRMHSSRMRTVRCSSRLLGGVCPGGLSAQGGCLPQCMLGHTSPPVDRILDTRLWKYYLSATSFADGKDMNLNLSIISAIKHSEDTSHRLVALSLAPFFLWFNRLSGWQLSIINTRSSSIKNAKVAKLTVTVVRPWLI